MTEKEKQHWAAEEEEEEEEEGRRRIVLSCTKVSNGVRNL
jgi:hypothetical protein